MLDYIINKTTEYLDGMPKAKRKKIGQFFTGIETARFMASLFSLPQKEHLDILDPGTGSAILTSALIASFFRLFTYWHGCMYNNLLISY